MGQKEEFRVVRTNRHMFAVELSGLETAYLYDTGEDPYEMNNLAGKPEAEQLERQLRRLLFQLAVETDDKAVADQLKPSSFTLEEIEK